MANKHTPTKAGNNLNQMRTMAGHTQQSLADAAGVSQKTISAIETGRIPFPTIQTAFALAQVLDCEPDEFLEFTFKKRPKTSTKLSTLKKKLSK
ncbi:DNA binding protein [Bacillus phage 031MP004]|nr:DNA binding protein [Bacillus phage 022DV001]QFG05454.1 DNA binding protein [Bacillus phage 031MP003]QFG05543.1 DNA binding protein [Bacillus phage 031MP002]QFG05629.1 DNA binding protein [Bacillus phage 031MP004]QFG05801.1 DNA binding protein [Bacillus phage 055SW001]